MDDELQQYQPFYYPRLKEVCERLDNFYEISSIRKQVKPSTLFLGAVASMHEQNRAVNPDWIAQTAHSLREIFYDIKQLNNKISPYSVTYKSGNTTQTFTAYFGLITELAHHNFDKASQRSLIGGTKTKPVPITEEIFIKVFLDFAEVLFAVLRKQLDVHSEFDSILNNPPEICDLKHLKLLLGLNNDAKLYFFTKTNEQWLSWLWLNGLLDDVTVKSANPTTYSYSMPELRYLARMVATLPAEVTNILHAVPVGPDTFNPEVVDQFLRICGELPASELARVVDGRNLLQKIRDEQWVVLMQGFNRWGYEYQLIMKQLVEAKEWSGLITIAGAVLTTRPAVEAERGELGLLLNTPFYFTNFEHTEVFEYLVQVDDSHVEAALQLLITTINAVIAFHASTDDSQTIFPVKDGIYLFDLDFFTLEPGQGRRISDRDDVRELISAMKLLAERFIYREGRTMSDTKAVYTQTLGQLMDTATMFKLRLYMWSRQPEVFASELKTAFNRLFTCTDSYYDILSGTEYLKALKETFTIVFTPVEQAAYVENVIRYFSEKIEEEPDKQWHLQHAGEIFSMIASYIESNPELKDRISAMGASVVPEYTPKPGMMSGQSGTVHPRGPITKEEFTALSLEEIATKLRTEWTPEELKKRDRGGDFLRPLDADGTGDLVKGNVAERLNEYITKSQLFFEPDTLHLHYTYSLLRGIEEVLRANTHVADIDWRPLFSLFAAIRDYVVTNEVELSRTKRPDSSSWLSGWSGVHMAMTDILHALLREKDGKTPIKFTQYRDELIATIDHLLTYPDPEPEGEELETARMTVTDPQDKQKLVGDPFSIAINSVRGRAFQALAMFVYVDGKQFGKDEAVKLAPDVQELYTRTLEREQTRALYFLYGHYLPTFYFRAPDWTFGHLDTIFTSDPDKYHLYLAAWEGYLAANLFEELFFDERIQALYHRGLHVEKELSRRYYRDPEAGLATHIALAMVAYYKNFTVEHPLFVAFWRESDTKQKGEFVSNIGRLYVASDNDRLTSFLEREPAAKEVLRNLWDWVIAHSDEPALFAEFGFWMSTKNGVFEKQWLANRIRITLEKSHGDIEWDHGFTQIIEGLVAVAPEEFVSIARNYLLEGAVKRGRFMRPMRYDRQWFTVFTTLYNNPTTKAATLDLINELLEKGGSDYWELKKVIV